MDRVSSVRLWTSCAGHWSSRVRRVCICRGFSCPPRCLLSINWGPSVARPSPEPRLATPLGAVRHTSRCRSQLRVSAYQAAIPRPPSRLPHQSILFRPPHRPSETFWTRRLVGEGPSRAYIVIAKYKVDALRGPMVEAPGTAPGSCAHRSDFIGTRLQYGKKDRGVEPSLTEKGPTC